VIGRLAGLLVEKTPPSLVLDVQGVGYEVDAPMSTFYNLPMVGEPVTLLTHLVVREDAQLLYGFSTAAERALFRMLLKVNGVGAKVALSILSGMTLEEFFHCLGRQDARALTRIPGIGKKTAERLVVELKDKADDLSPQLTSDVAGVDTSTGDTMRTQAETALIALSYKPAEAARMLDKSADPSHASVEAMIRAALRSVQLG